MCRTLIARFASETGKGVFEHIRRADVAAGLKERIVDANKIDQRGSSLCGPTVLVRTIASTDPVAYVRYVTDLYDHGRSVIGRLVVEPGEDLRSYDLAQQLNAADWIALASLRDSENFLFDYDEVSDQFSGITLPSHLEDWFREAGFFRRSSTIRT